LRIRGLHVKERCVLVVVVHRAARREPVDCPCRIDIDGHRHVDIGGDDDHLAGRRTVHVDGRHRRFSALVPSKICFSTTSACSDRCRKRHPDGERDRRIGGETLLEANLGEHVLAWRDDVHTPLSNCTAFASSGAPAAAAAIGAITEVGASLWASRASRTELAAGRESRRRHARGDDAIVVELPAADRSRRCSRHTRWQR